MIRHYGKCARQDDLMRTIQHQETTSMYTITVQAADGTEVIRTTATEIGLTAVRAVCGLAAPAPAPRPGRGRRGEKKKMTEEGSNAHRARILIRAVTTGKWLTGAPISRTYAFRQLRQLMQTDKLYAATRKQAEVTCSQYLQSLVDGVDAVDGVDTLSARDITGVWVDGIQADGTQTGGDAVWIPDTSTASRRIDT